MKTLTDRELLVLQLVSDGDSYNQIIKRTHLSRTVVKTALTSVRDKLNARSTAHAVAIAYRAGLLDEDGCE